MDNPTERHNFLTYYFIYFFNFLKNLFLFYLIGRLITLQYSGGFCHTFTWISRGCTCPHPIPQGHPSAPALSTLSHASNLDWRSISLMMIYMFQCYSLKSSHPCLFPQSPKVCSLHDRINLWVSMSPVCGAGPQFDGLGLTSFSDTQPAEQYFCLVPWEQLPNETVTFQIKWKSFN